MMSNMEHTNINSIKQLRIKYNLTQKEFADILGISERNVRRKENGYAPFSQYEMIKILLMFNLTQDDFYRLFVINCKNFTCLRLLAINLNNKKT